MNRLAASRNYHLAGLEPLPMVRPVDIFLGKHQATRMVLVVVHLAESLGVHDGRLVLCRRHQRPALRHQALEELLVDAARKDDLYEEVLHDLRHLTGRERDADVHRIADRRSVRTRHRLDSVEVEEVKRPRLLVANAVAGTELDHYIPGSLEGLIRPFHGTPPGLHPALLRNG